MSLLRIDELRVTTRTRELVHGIDLRIETGEWLAVVGESGSGKSLTAFSIANLLPRGLRRHAKAMRFSNKDLLSLSKEEMRQLRGNDIAYDAPRGEVALYDGAQFFGVGEGRDGRLFPLRLCALAQA